ncbi:MAG: hypothetical protein OER56_02465 [Hyphomicrobiales bacterium]|nr:hypothetical protein [Hyphomicrobiales bacterium]
MEIFILTFVVIGLAALGMAVGVLVKGSELKGTCATLSGADYASIACEICPARHWHGARKPGRCPRRDALNQIADSSGNEMQSR